MNRLTIVSTDCHAGLPTERYLDYLASAFHDELHDYLRERSQARQAGAVTGTEKMGFGPFSQQFVDDFRREALLDDGGTRGGWEFDRRRKELEADGIVAEVIFPGPVNLSRETSIPFQGRTFFGDDFTARRSLESMWEGARAYNRWLAEAFDRSRQAALALIPTMTDIDEVVRELSWARANGFSGVLLLSMEDGVAPFYHDRYEPVWAGCADLGLIVHFHGGVGTPIIVQGGHRAQVYVSSIEGAWFNYRPLWHLMCSGVFERYPGLRVGFTEVHASWVPSVIDMLDARYEDNWYTFSQLLPNKPSEYWYRQCFIGGSFLSRREVELREVIGADGLTYGADYPHPEGIWPRTKHYLHEVMAGVPAADVRKILSENPARIYGFDLPYLDSLAATVGPTVEEIVGGEPSHPDFRRSDRMVSRAARPASSMMAGPSRKLWP
jgi:predicted TIM-barrel fold metal-dependent hydrolase